MKKISTRRITVITSPEDSSEFQREGKPNSTSSIQDRRVVARFFCSIQSGEKKSSFPNRGTNPLYFSRNSPKGHIKERKAEEGKKGTAPLVFFNPQTLRSQSSPLVFVFLVRLSHYFIFFPRFFLIHRTHASHPFALSLSPAALGLPPVSSRDFHPLAEFFLREFPPPPPSPFSSGLFSRRTARLRFRVFDYLVCFSRVLFSSVSVFLSITVWKHAWFCKCL